MKSIKLSFPLGLVFIFLSAITGYKSFGQGCSDAGFCTIGNLRIQQIDSVIKSQSIKLLLSSGVGDEQVFVFTPGIQYDNQLSQRWSIQTKITANHARGTLGNASGLGDLFLSGTRILLIKKKWKASATLGTKLPLNLGNLKEGGKALPMQYQSSLGTIDLIAGLSLSSASWQFASGWQQPLSGINRNNFLPVYWNTTEAARYLPSNDFNRSGDILIRAAYLSNFKRSFSLHIGLLGIYHIDEDTYIDANVSNKPIAIQDSQGLTLNTTISGFWKLNKNIKAGILVGAPLVVREARPDGLTRSFVLMPELTWNF